MNNLSDIQIVEYQPLYRERFKEINVQWITRDFFMEDEDIKTELQLEQNRVLCSSSPEYCLSNELVSPLATAAVLFDVYKGYISEWGINKAIPNNSFK